MVEVIRVTCQNKKCVYLGVVHEYDENYRQHAEWRCGECGGELKEVKDG